MWTLPFVSRARLTDAQAEAKAWEARYEALRARHDAYVLTVMELGVKSSAPSQTVPRETTPPDPVMAAIAARAGNSGPTRRILGAFVSRERARGTPDDRIIARIEDWTISDEDQEREQAIARNREADADRRAAEEALAFELSKDDDLGVPTGL